LNVQIKIPLAPIAILDLIHVKWNQNHDVKIMELAIQIILFHRIIIVTVHLDIQDMIVRMMIERVRLIHVGKRI
jgi:hypothetical protein